LDHQHRRSRGASVKNVFRYAGGTENISVPPAIDEGNPMFNQMNHRGDAILEWVILGAVVIAVLGAALYAVSRSISAKLNDVNVQIGS